MIRRERVRALNLHVNPTSDAGGEHRGAQYTENQARGKWQVTRRFRTDFKQKIAKRAKAQTVHRNLRFIRLLAKAFGVAFCEIGSVPRRKAHNPLGGF